MKFYYIGILAFGIILNSAFALQGGRDSGGGNAVVCTNQTGKIVSAELLDLYEGRALYGRAYVEKPSHYLKQALSYSIEIDQAMGTFNVDGGRNFVADEAVRVDLAKRLLPSGTGLVPIDDSQHFVIPKNCKVMQLATYRPNREVFIDSDIWNLLTPTNKSALLVHEALYYNLRFGADQTSERVRKTVSLLFSGFKLESKLDPVNPMSKIEYCRTFDAFENARPETNFMTYLTRDGRINMQFFTIAGFNVISRSIIKSLPNQQGSWPISDMNHIVTVSDDISSLVEEQIHVGVQRRNRELFVDVRLINGKYTEEKVECSVY